MAVDLPVWYLQAGVKDATTGDFTRIKDGSATLVTLQEAGGGPVQALITAQHVLRTSEDQSTGPYATAFRAWPPGVGYNDGTAVELTLMEDLAPDPTAALLDNEDLAFLQLPPSASGSTSARLMEVDESAHALLDLTVSGYPGGLGYIKNHGYNVHPSRHPEWELSGTQSTRAISILSSGQAPPLPGVSGGGVFRDGRYAGIYRGEFRHTGEHLFLPLTRIRDWCSDRQWPLLTAPSVPLPGWLVALAVPGAVGLAAGTIAAFSLGPYFTYAAWFWLPCLVLGVALIWRAWKNHLKRVSSPRTVTTRERTTSSLCLWAAAAAAGLGLVVPLNSLGKAVITASHASPLKMLRNSLKPGTVQEYKAANLAATELHQSIRGPMLILPERDLERYRVLEAKFEDGVGFRTNLVTQGALHASWLSFHSHFVLSPPPPPPETTP